MSERHGKLLAGIRRRRLAVVSALALASAGGASACASSGGKGRARNVIQMVPDGMGLANVTATRIYRYGLDGMLRFETLEHIGYQRTYSANSTVTDSAPAASAWACGEKFENREICFHGDGRPAKPSILELARKQGKATGLVATSTITHATPASFGAHVANRNCEHEIARQYVQVTGPDLMFGGGVDKFRSTAPDACGTQGDFIAEAKGKGYAVAHDRMEMDAAVAQGSRKVLGLFGKGGMVPEHLRTPAETQPRLPEMTAAALKVLEKNPAGFFLLVEGSQIDWANHANDYPYQLGEMLAFDDAVQVVRDWIDADVGRKARTLLIVVADHDTGGFAINGPQAALLRKGQTVEPGWTIRNHTGVDTLIWSQGPGSQDLARALDNTEIYGVMVKALGASREE
jgi:alkaline phosphatase